MAFDETRTLTVVNTGLLCILLAVAVVQLWTAVAAGRQLRRRDWSWVGAAEAHAGADAAGQCAAGAGSCSAAGCGAADPVSDPDYNMREIAKQCILLEEHLTVDAKYCVDCVAKHLLHCQALATEAVMLACDRVARYPFMAESPAFFQGLLEAWLEQRVDPDARRAIAAQVREYRKRVVQAYFTSPAEVTRPDFVA